MKNRIEMLRELCNRLREMGLEEREATAEARYMLTFLLKVPLSELYLWGNELLSAECEQKLQEILQRRKKGEPLAYILGERYFMGLPFKVKPGILIPRQETELLCEQAIETIQKEHLERVLDLCTGSGCIAVSIAKFSEASVWAADISETAVEMTRENARRQNVSLQVIQSDLFLNVQNKYDMITANPPYIDDEAYAGLEYGVRNYEPALALQGGPDGLEFYRRIAAQAPEYLRPGGYLIQEIGYNQGEAVRKLLSEQGFSEIEIRQDYAGLDRIVWARWPY
jgi:release factor glutamine methyltransferase